MIGWRCRDAYQGDGQSQLSTADIILIFMDHIMTVCHSNIKVNLGCNLKAGDLKTDFEYPMLVFPRAPDVLRTRRLGLVDNPQAVFAYD